MCQPVYIWYDIQKSTKIHANTQEGFVLALVCNDVHMYSK